MANVFASSIILICILLCTKIFKSEKKYEKRVLLTSLLTIALCFSLMFGATYALFTSESKVNIAVTSGKIEAVATVSKIELFSMDV